MKISKLLVLWFSVFLSFSVFSANTVRGVRAWTAPNNARVVFDTTMMPKYSIFSLDNPRRLVVDIKSAALKTNLGLLNFVNSPVLGIRASNRDNGDLRFVLDVVEGANGVGFTLMPSGDFGNRLVLDIEHNINTAPTSEKISTTPEKHNNGIDSSYHNPSDTNTVRTTINNTASSNVSNVNKSKKLVSDNFRDIIVVIDAGHGGNDPGAISRSKAVYEKTVNLEIARILKQEINKFPGFHAILTRDSDIFLQLRERTNIARAHKADLFISIHADAAPNTRASGVSIYALSEKGATSETARWLADKENKADLVGGLGEVLTNQDQMVSEVILDMSMTATLSSSLDVGQKILNHLGKTVNLHKKKVEQAAFMVLKNPDIPSILVETGFVSNVQESLKLINKTHQLKIANLIAKGVKDFFNANPPNDTILYANKHGISYSKAADTKQHKVTSGDTLTSIARKYNIKVIDIMQLNNLQNTALKVGQVLRIPAI